MPEGGMATGAAGRKRLLLRPEDREFMVTSAHIAPDSKRPVKQQPQAQVVKCEQNNATVGTRGRRG